MKVKLKDRAVLGKVLKKPLNKLRDKLFSKIHSNYLIYNTCWEDPRIDRQLLKISKESTIVMITSAGCNALDYLLDDPNAIHCIDLNPRQNSLLDLKKAIFKVLDFPTLFQFFGKGSHLDYKTLYQTKIKPHLPAYATAFWDSKIKYFNPKSRRKSFYFYGTLGTFAFIFDKFLKTRGIMPLFDQLLEVKNTEDQKAIYDKIEPKVMNKLVLWVMNRQLILSLLGVPRPQRQLIMKTYKGGLSQYIADNLRHIFTNLPIYENYFWRVYLKGEYTPECSPNYLKEVHFNTISKRIDRIQTYTTSFAQFLKDNPGQYSHFILLDHQDWLASYAPELLEEEWQLILDNSRPGTLILMRSASLQIDFLPEFVLKAVEIDQELTPKLHKTDRVGTYGCTYLMTVK